MAQLTIDGNQLTALPREIGQQLALTHFSLSNNQLTALPAEIGQLHSLCQFYLDKNNLTTLPAEIRNLRALKQLYLHDNPGLPLSTETLGPTWQEASRQGGARPGSPTLILDTYFAIQRGSRPLHEVKLVLIGRGGAGKTSLVRALQGQAFDEKEAETPGIGIGSWRLKCKGTEVTVHIWDFAGQEITHEAHRFFLTERCLYLVVVEGRQNLQDDDADHWLAHVEQYGTHREDGKPGQTSPALVVANKADLVPAELDEERLRREHACVRGFLETDCQTGRGISALRQRIAQVIEGAEMESVRQPFPTEWQQMKERLEDWKGLKRHFLTETEFAKECAAHGVRPGDQLALTQVLNQLGIALYYGNNPKLRDNRVLNPQWLANGMYALIRGVERHGDPKRPGELKCADVTTRLEQGLALMKTFRNLKRARGRAKKQLLDSVAKPALGIGDYPCEAQAFLLELMEDRELCFVAREGEKGAPIYYLLPGLLPKSEPRGVVAPYLAAAREQVRLRYTYRLLPEGLLPRFIVRTHPLSKDRPRWRRGVVLRWSGAEGGSETSATALVLANQKTKQIEVSVRAGSEHLRRELAGMVRTHLAAIHRELPSALHSEEELELSPAGEQWLKVRTLEQAAQSHQLVQVEFANKLENLLPQPELERIAPSTAWEKDAAKRALRVFISYSHKDHRLLNDFATTYLAVLENERLIQHWTDGEIRAGEDWDNRIRDEIRTTDIVILLVSEDFLASKYIMGVEAKLAQERQINGTIEILPVLLSGQSYLQTEYEWIRKLQMAPKVPKSQQLVPLVDFAPRRAKGWEVVQSQLRKVIGDIRMRRCRLL